jgi:hypothetical protein
MRMNHFFKVYVNEQWNRKKLQQILSASNPVGVDFRIRLVKELNLFCPSIFYKNIFVEKVSTQLSGVTTK